MNRCIPKSSILSCTGKNCWLPNHLTFLTVLLLSKPVQAIFMIRILLLAIILFSVAGCRHEQPPPKEVTGYAPVYEAKIVTATVSFETARAIENAGKIYTKGYRLYQVENGKGIHVISIEDPALPDRIGFINVPGARELSILNNFLYTNNGNDLLVLDITHLNQIEVMSRIDNAFSLESFTLPPASGYFECVDPSKGIVTGWMQKTLYSPKCRY